MTIQDILNKVNDYLAHYTTGSANIEQKIRAIDSAVDYYKLRITIPSDKKTTIIDYNSDQVFYKLPDDFLYPIILRYYDEDLNREEKRFHYVDFSEITRKLGYSLGKNLWSWTTRNGKNYLVIKAENRFGKYLISGCDSIENFSVGDDANNLSLDNIIKKEGSGSISFGLEKTLSGNNYGSLNLVFSSNENWTSRFDDDGYVRAWIYLPTTNLSSINLVVSNNSLNYWQIQATTQDDGSPFALGWNRIMWRLLSGSQVGSFNQSAVSGISFRFVENQSFNDISGFRIDEIEYFVPDKLELTYVSSFKGKNGNGEDIKTFTSVGDVPSFANFAPALSNLIALRAVSYLMPQVLKDVNYLTLFKAEEKEILATLGQIYPKEMRINYGKTEFIR